MTAEFGGANVVINAERFNPAVFGQLWLIKSGVLNEEEFESGCVFTDDVAQVHSKDFNILVLPPRAQFVPKSNDAQNEQAIIEGGLGRIVEKLPETPYRAVGFNFEWRLSVEDGQIEAASRKLFFSPSDLVHQTFDFDDARFGTYASKDSLGFRLKLTVAPSYEPTVAGNVRDVIAMRFNYHLGFGEAAADSVSLIRQQLSRWNEARSEAEGISNSLADALNSQQ